MRIACACLLIGCAGGTGVDLALVADPNLNSTEDLIAAVDSIVVIVDSEEGLYEPGEEESVGNVQIENVDRDPALEVVSTVVVPDDHLPVIRLLRGTLADIPLDVRFLGVPPAGGPPVALGHAQSVELADPIEHLDVPFNLRPDLLPPRIVQVLPSDGMVLDPCTLSTVILMFSVPIDASTVAPAVLVEGRPPDEVVVDATGLTAQLTVSGIDGSGTELRYSIDVAPTIRGRDGRMLDQVPPQPGDQGLEANYILTCSVRTEAPADPCGGCGQSGLSCVEGECVPAGCDNVQCTADSVCDPTVSRCTLDCRIWGDDVCPDARPRCDGATGVCVD